MVERGSVSDRLKNPSLAFVGMGWSADTCELPPWVSRKMADRDHDIHALVAIRCDNWP